MKRILGIMMVGLLAAGWGCSKDNGNELDTSRAQFSDGQSFWVMYTPNPDPIPVGEDFAMTVMVHDGADQTTLMPSCTIEVGAWMPSMGHGMPNPPTVTPNGDGTFAVSGMNFIMGGHWELTVDVTDAAATETATFNVMAE